MNFDKLYSAIAKYKQISDQLFLKEKNLENRIESRLTFLENTSDLKIEVQEPTQ